MSQGKASGLYHTALRAAREDFERNEHFIIDLVQELDQARLKRDQLRQTIVGLAALCGEQPDESIGLTEACREVIRATNQPLNLVTIRTGVEALGYSLADQKNAMATLNTVMSRLVTKGEADLIVGDGPRANALVNRLWKRRDSPDTAGGKK